jgi:hypothetical protein
MGNGVDGPDWRRTVCASCHGTGAVPPDYASGTFATKGNNAMKTCETCKHARPAGEKLIECRRYPPTVLKVEGAAVTSAWPIRRDREDCGEYTAKRSSK